MKQKIMCGEKVMGKTMTDTDYIYDIYDWTKKINCYLCLKAISEENISNLYFVGQSHPIFCKQCEACDENND